ncbi:hypothetical protein PCE1_001254 [Barthelona sp. PCE]
MSNAIDVTQWAAQRREKILHAQRMREEREQMQNPENPSRYSAVNEHMSQDDYNRQQHNRVDYEDDYFAETEKKEPEFEWDGKFADEPFDPEKFRPKKKKKKRKPKESNTQRPYSRNSQGKYKNFISFDEEEEEEEDFDFEQPKPKVSSRTERKQYTQEDMGLPMTSRFDYKEPNDVTNFYTSRKTEEERAEQPKTGIKSSLTLLKSLTSVNRRFQTPRSKQARLRSANSARRSRRSLDSPKTKSRQTNNSIPLRTQRSLEKVDPFEDLNLQDAVNDFSGKQKPSKERQSREDRRKYRPQSNERRTQTRERQQKSREREERSRREPEPEERHAPARNIPPQVSHKSEINVDDQPVGVPLTSAEEAIPEYDSVQLVACSICQRRFNKDRLAKHTKICRKNQEKDAKRQALIAKKNANKPKPVASPKKKSPGEVPKWKLDAARFRLIRLREKYAAKNPAEQFKLIMKDKLIRELEQLKPGFIDGGGSVDTRVACRFCSRKFAEDRIAKHESVCPQKNKGGGPKRRAPRRRRR